MSQPLRIVLDARATTAHFPGVGRAILGLLHGLAEIETPHKLAVLAYGAAPPPDDPAFGRPTIRRVPTRAAPLGLAQQWQLPLVARALRADLWHAPYYVRPFRGVPRPIVTVYDVIGRVLPAALPALRSRLLFRLTLRWSLRGAAHVIASSEATRRDLERLYGIAADGVTVIPLAADARFRPQPGAELSRVRALYALPDRYLLYVGSNKPHKNLVDLVSAYAGVDTAAPLVIAGRTDPRYPEAARVVAQLGIGERVRFVPDVDDRDLPGLLAGALAFVFPSRYEGFGLPPLEAMACGAPVIASNASSLPEVVGDAGLLVPPTAAALRDALQRVVDDPQLREELRQRGLERAAAFSWAETARRTVAVYETIHEGTQRWNDTNVG